jgi:hypothetical protein
MIIVLVSLVGYAVYKQGLKAFETQYTLDCKLPYPCANSMYLQCADEGCLHQFIQPNEVFYINQQRYNLPALNWIAGICFVMFILINHFMFNRDYPIREKLKELRNDGTEH